MLSTSTALPQVMVDSLDQLADELGVSRGKLIRSVLQTFLDEHQEAAGD